MPILSRHHIRFGGNNFWFAWKRDGRIIIQVCRVFFTRTKKEFTAYHPADFSSADPAVVEAYQFRYVLHIGSFRRRWYGTRFYAAESAS